MTHNIDIYRTGNEATTHRSSRHEGSWTAGLWHHDGQAVWKQILAAIEELLSEDWPEQQKDGCV